MSKKPEPLRRTSAQLKLSKAADDLLIAAGDTVHREQVKVKVVKPLGEHAPETPIIPNRNRSRKPVGINLRKVAEVLSEEGLDPTVEIVRILRSGELDPDVAARVQLELLQYCQPKLKAIEVTGKDGGPLQGEVNLSIGFVGAGKSKD